MSDTVERAVRGDSDRDGKEPIGRATILLFVVNLVRRGRAG